MIELEQQHVSISRRDYQVTTPGALDVVHAHTISALTQEAGSMLPKTPEQMIDIFRKGHSVIITDSVGNVMSHAAATFAYSTGAIEVGAVVTANEHKRKGLATVAVIELIEKLKQQYFDKTLFALANPMSAPLFQKIGGVPMNADELPDDVWEECATCPKNPNKTTEQVVFHCCDIPYNLTGI